VAAVGHAVKTVPHFIDGADVASPKRLPKRSPVDGRLLAEVCEASTAQIDVAVQSAARAASGPWSNMDVDSRADLLMRPATAVDLASDELTSLEVDDTGKPMAIARQEIARVSENFRTFARVARQWRSEHREVQSPSLGRFRHHGDEAAGAGIGSLRAGNLRVADAGADGDGVIDLDAMCETGCFP